MKRITYKDRQILEKLLKINMSIRKIAKALDFSSHTPILYEISHHCGESMEYDADRAQVIYERNQLKKGNIKKLNSNPILREYILKKLSNDLSPEQISGQLKTIKELQVIANGYVCMETIYSYIYNKENKKYGYWNMLMRHKPKRIKTYNRRKNKGGSVKNMISISNRPKEINDRKEIGHWESDSMIFSNQKEILSVQVERKTRYVSLTKCKNKTADETYEAIISRLGDKDSGLLKTITFDRGTEGARHEKIAELLKVKIYFCDPYSSWQKGSVENRNMFIRRYLPRNINMSKVTDQDIYKIQEKLNNRPMKCLGYRTPNEMMFYEKYGRYKPILE